MTEYDPQRDMNESLQDCYRAIRERQAAGGPGYAPGATGRPVGAPKEKGATEAAPSTKTRL
jgi:hypothetical protein